MEERGQRCPVVAKGAFTKALAAASALSEFEPGVRTRRPLHDLRQGTTGHEISFRSQVGQGPDRECQKRLEVLPVDPRFGEQKPLGRAMGAQIEFCCNLIRSLLPQVPVFLVSAIFSIGLVQTFPNQLALLVRLSIDASAVLVPHWEPVRASFYRTEFTQQIVDRFGVRGGTSFDTLLLLPLDICIDLSQGFIELWGPLFDRTLAQFRLQFRDRRFGDGWLISCHASAAAVAGLMAQGKGVQNGVPCT